VRGPLYFSAALAHVKSLLLIGWYSGWPSEPLDAVGIKTSAWNQTQVIESVASHFTDSSLGCRARVCVCVCVRACVRARVCVCVREREIYFKLLYSLCHSEVMSCEMRVCVIPIIICACHTL